MPTPLAHRTNRRTFLHQSTVAAGTAVAAFHIVPRHVLGGPRHVPPSEKIRIALVGAGGRGRKNLLSLMPYDDAQVIAVADPAEYWDLHAFYYKSEAGRKPIRAMLEKHYGSKTSNYRVAEYKDFRVMLEKEKSLDAVLCATPDHLHAYVSVLSMRAGKHVYCEKPLTHNIHEARLVAAVAKETGVATQMGNQGHSNEGIRLTCEWIWAGAIGTVREVHAWVNARRWNPTLQGKPAGSTPLPAGLDWDLWLGPREPRPFHSAYAPVTWRDFWAFGCGALGDFGCHDLDAATWALDLHAPKTVEATAAGYTDAEIAPYGSIVYFRFPARGDRPPVKLTWYDGGLQPARPDALPSEVDLMKRGVLFVGEKGVLLCGGAGGVPRLFRNDRAEAPAPPAKKLPRSKGHHRDWLDAIKGGPPAGSNFEYGTRLVEIVLLGVASLRTGKRLDWDPENMKARGVPEADAIFTETNRKGWELT